MTLPYLTVDTKKISLSKKKKNYRQLQFVRLSRIKLDTQITLKQVYQELYISSISIHYVTKQCIHIIQTFIHKQESNFAFISFDKQFKIIATLRTLALKKQHSLT